VEFLGVDLCKGSVSTAVVLPDDSPLTIESVEVGSKGDLVILLAAKKGNALAQVDDLMEQYTGSRGTGTTKALQWSGRKITAYGKEVTKKYVALAVSTSDVCDAEDDAAATAAQSNAEPRSEPAGSELVIADEPVEAAMVAAAAAEQREPVPAPVEDEDPDRADPVPVEDPIEPTPDFELLGSLKHAIGPQGWVDVMGVVVNHTDRSLQLVTFDLALFDTEGTLICVDTISVSVLKAGQQRAFRDSIRCEDYQEDAVADISLQFAGGY
jgi:hypothetical protein